MIWPWTQILIQLQQLNRKMDKMSMSMDDILVAVAAERTEVESMKVFIQALKDKITSTMGVLTPEQQAKLDQIFAEVVNNTTEIHAAIAASSAQI